MMMMMKHGKEEYMVFIDMKMPEACFECRFCIDMKTEEYGDKYVKCAARNLPYFEEAGMGDMKPDWCPLIDIK